MTNYNHRQQKNSGIALLMTVMVLSVVLSVTLAIVELTLQQLALSVDSRDSEVAFHAANAGLECARYTRRNASTTFEGGSGIGGPISMECFGLPPSNMSRPAASGVEIMSGATAPATGKVREYKKQLTWSGNRCSEMDILVMLPDPTVDLVIKAPSGGHLNTVFPSYPTPSKRCESGGVCTIISVSGYNVPCGAGTTAEGTLKRQVLLEF